MYKNQKGFGIIAIVIVLIVISLVGLASWKVLHKNSGVQTTDQSTIKESTNASDNKDKNTEAAQSYIAIEDWGVKVAAPDGQVAVVSELSGPNYITGAEGGVYLYITDYDSKYTCGSDEGETHKAKLGAIQKFSSGSNIENNDRNKPDVLVENVGNAKYGFYALRDVGECYGADAASEVEAIIKQYLTEFSVIAS